MEIIINNFGSAAPKIKVVIDNYVLKLPLRLSTVVESTKISDVPTTESSKIIFYNVQKDQPEQIQLVEHLRDRLEVICGDLYSDNWELSDDERYIVTFTFKYAS